MEGGATWVGGRSDARDTHAHTQLRTRIVRGAQPAGAFPALRVRRGAKRVLGVCAAPGSLFFSSSKMTTPAILSFLPLAREAAGWDPLLPSVGQPDCAAPRIRAGPAFPSVRRVRCLAAWPSGPLPRSAGSDGWPYFEVSSSPGRRWALPQAGFLSQLSLRARGTQSFRVFFFKGVIGGIGGGERPSCCLSAPAVEGAARSAPHPGAILPPVPRVAKGQSLSQFPVTLVLGSDDWEDADRLPK